MAAEPKQLKQVKELGRKEILLSVARASQGDRVLLGASDAKVYDWNLAAEKEPPKEFVGHSSYVSGVALIGGQLLSAGYDGKLIWRALDSGEIVREVKAHAKWIRRLAASPDGKFAVTVADDMVCRVWDVASGRAAHELRGHAERTPHHFPSMLYGAAISADSQLLATTDKLGHVVVWSLVKGEKVAELDAPGLYTWDPTARIHSIGGARCLAFSPDGEKLAVGGMGKVGNIDHLEGKARLELFDWRKGTHLHTHESDKFKGLVERLEFDPQGGWLLAVGGDHGGFIEVLDLASNKAVRQEKVSAHVHDHCWNESRDTLYLACHGKLAIWEMKN